MFNSQKGKITISRNIIINKNYVYKIKVEKTVKFL